MKQSRYNISLYIIIPFIFAGLTMLSSIVTLRVIEWSFNHHLPFVSHATQAILVFGVVAYICGLILVWVVLRPVEKFIIEAKQTPALLMGANDESPNDNGDQLEQFTQVFNQVTHTLSRVEAKHLFPDIIGHSTAMRGIMSQIIKVAPTDSTVFLLGESGTGKELIASSIYQHSLRFKKPFVKINCVAIPETLLESELFGYERGAFTGATARKIGKFEQAHGGTIFLDEIGDMPASIQGKMLRVLQEREIDRLGGTKPIKVDVRIIAATNKNIEHMVRDGSFREDLYYRLNVFAIKIPPLSERKEDIPLLVENFLKKSKADSFKLTNAAMQSLSEYNWPGNIRELQNIMESAAVMSDQGVIKSELLPAKITRGIPDPEGVGFGQVATLDKQLQKMEKSIIVETLRKTNGVQVKAAEILGINQRSLWHRVKKYGIDVKQIKKQQ